MTVDPGGSDAPMSERMQSLLSRAVEDQMSEQRELAGALNDVRGQLERVVGELGAMRSAGAGNSVAAITDEIRDVVRMLADRLDGVARMVLERGADMTEMRSSVSDLEKVVRSHTEALSGVSGGLAALPALGERIGGLQDNLSGLSASMNGLNELAGAVTALQQRVDHLSQELRETRAAFTGIASRVADIPVRADIETAFGRLGDPMSALAQRIGAMEEAVRALATRPVGADGPASAVDLTGIQAELGRLSEAVGQQARQRGEQFSAVDAQLRDLAAAVERRSTAEAPSADTGVEQVQSGLNELRESLFGPNGLSTKVDALVNDDVETRVSAAVDESVTKVENRLTAHIDEAILALAQALLRPRPQKSSAARAMAARVAAEVAATPTAPSAATPAPAPAPAPAAAEPVTPAPRLGRKSAASAPAPALDAEPAQPEQQTASAAAAETKPPAAPADKREPGWQTPPPFSPGPPLAPAAAPAAPTEAPESTSSPASGEPSAPSEQASEPAEPERDEVEPTAGEPGRRRRPWWRPGD
jgi:hypothetical protein